ncbi:uncharacterized protein EV420DRAFT_1744331 [Desarmillaria tabescens]|uniref:Uncharacterized protein n=1 Tax=Armillaria tabescens TaxID=1929756 RepID=A0AA39NGC7_ARMTA|nr:uncharacterized protein EV420DRAFT_1744331 [Desarmillaria tabescens]KAK0465129.1 hypothetical protein EV420DRAFT_1744331 [Desarmillaria tabescens]
MTPSGDESRATKRQRTETESSDAPTATPVTTTEAAPSEKPKRKYTKATKTAPDPSSVNEDAKRIAARLVSDLLDKYCDNEKQLSVSRQHETEQVKQMLEAQKAVSEAQKAASEAQKAASDAALLAEEARLATLKFAFEHKLSLTSPETSGEPATATPHSQDLPKQPQSSAQLSLASSHAQPQSHSAHPAFQSLQQLQSLLYAQQSNQALPQTHPYSQLFPQQYPQPAPAPVLNNAQTVAQPGVLQAFQHQLDQLISFPPETQ